MSQEGQSPPCSLGEPEAAAGPARPLPWGSAGQASAGAACSACAAGGEAQALSRSGGKDPWERQRPEGGCLVGPASSGEALLSWKA